MSEERAPAMVPIDEIVAIITEQATFSKSAADQAVFVQLFDSGLSPERIAALMGIRLGTVYNLMARRDVQAAVQRGREARTTTLRMRMTNAAERGIDVFLEVMNDKHVVGEAEGPGGEVVQITDYVASPETRMVAAEKVLLWALGRPGTGDAGGQKMPGAYTPAYVQVNVGDGPPTAFRQRLAAVLEKDREEDVLEGDSEEEDGDERV